MTNQPTTGPNDFWKNALAIGGVIVIVALVEQQSPRAATLLVIAILLSVAYTQRAGVTNFAAWFSRQTAKL